MLEDIAVYIVANKNMAAVWMTSTHWMPPLTRLTGSKNAPMHWKNRTITIPRVLGGMNEMRMRVDRRTYMSAHRKILRPEENRRNRPFPRGTARMGSWAR